MTTEAQCLHISLPVDARFAQMLRLATSSIATTVGFTLEQIEDLKIAVEEAYLMSVEEPGAPGQLNFRFTLLEDRLEVCVGTLPAQSAGEEEGDERRVYGLMILRAVVDEVRFVAKEGGAELVMVKLKRSEA